MFISFAGIAVGSHWSRTELAKLWGYKAYQALARGVVTPAGDNKIILFVTEEKQVSAMNYQDVLHGDVLAWEGPNDHFAEEKILSAKEKGQEIHLFHRPRHHMDFTYQGKLTVLSVTQLTVKPSKFVFQLLNTGRQG